jgi:hypothetical protein
MDLESRLVSSAFQCNRNQMNLSVSRQSMEHVEKSKQIQRLQVQRLNSLIESHTKQSGGPTKGSFRVSTKTAPPCLCYSFKGSVCPLADVWACLVLHSTSINIYHSIDQLNSFSTPISNQPCATPKISFMPSATTGLHNHKSTTNVVLPVNLIITTPATRRRLQARGGRTTSAFNADLTPRRRSRTKVRGSLFPIRMARLLSKSAFSSAASYQSEQAPLISGPTNAGPQVS